MKLEYLCMELCRGHFNGIHVPALQVQRAALSEAVWVVPPENSPNGG